MWLKKVVIHWYRYRKYTMYGMSSKWTVYSTLNLKCVIKLFEIQFIRFHIFNVYSKVFDALQHFRNDSTKFTEIHLNDCNFIWHNSILEEVIRVIIKHFLLCVIDRTVIDFEMDVPTIVFDNVERFFSSFTYRLIHLLAYQDIFDINL